MKKRLFFFIVLFCSLSGFAQKKVVRQLTWHQPDLQRVVSGSASLHFISFFHSLNNPLEIKPDMVIPSSRSLVYDNRYSLHYLGHRYLFEKEFGHFPAELLRSKLDSLRRKDCYSSSYEGRIYADRIEITITSWCPDRSGDQLFEKIEDNPGYFGGPAAFQQLVQDRLKCTAYRDLLQGDSAFFLFAVLKKDSICHQVKPIMGTESPLVQMISKALTNTHGWKPYRKDGHEMNAYLQVFILLRKDGTIEADYLR